MPWRNSKIQEIVKLYKQFFIKPCSKGNKSRQKAEENQNMSAISKKQKTTFLKKKKQAHAKYHFLLSSQMKCCIQTTLTGSSASFENLPPNQMPLLIFEREREKSNFLFSGWSPKKFKWRGKNSLNLLGKTAPLSKANYHCACSITPLLSCSSIKPAWFFML